jgi:peptide alpha-N-acetyltransferase
MAASKAGDPSLPSKESALFKTIVKHYETKQYKKGLKIADSILKKFPDHGETLAMKGLILNCMERKAEAYELVRKGVKQDIKSHVCWHVYGLLYRSDRDYLQAIKCYRGALRHDKDNVQILRDLSLLQVQMRDLPGFVQTRQQLLTLKPTNRNNWFSFALAQHLQERYGQAVNIIESYEATLEGPPENDYEHSEMLLFKNMLIEESGDTARALEHLDSIETLVVDKLGFREKRGQLLLKLDQFVEAGEIYAELLARNPENVRYHAGRQAAALRTTTMTEQWQDAELAPGSEELLRSMYAALQLQFPRSSVCRRLPLDFARAPEYFRTVLAAYVLPLVRKGVPSLYANLKPLTMCTWKREAMGSLFSEWLGSLLQTGCLPGATERELPSSLLWIRVLVAQHADRCGDTAAAMEHIDAALEHTPTLIELFIFKARFFKHAGDLKAASEWMEQARGLDLADRYLNTKSTRYLLRADLIDQAQRTIALFTKDGDGPSNLFDMQCMWYELEAAHSHLRTGDYGRALKQFTSIEKHFLDIVEDQFDFHTYCIRKMTLRAYVALLRLEDRLWGHTFYVRAAHGAIETYFRIVDEAASGKAQAAQAQAEQGDELSASERKKAESKRKKAEAKARAEAEAKKEADKAEATYAKGKKSTSKEKPLDEDPDGAALASVLDPLARASVYLRMLQVLSSRW